MKRRSGFTLLEFVVSLVVIVVLLALGLPALQMAREASRRTTCNNRLKQIGLAVHNFATANGAFPPGTICSSGPILPNNEYDVWSEAVQSGPGGIGTGFLLRIAPYIGTPAYTAYSPTTFRGGVWANAGSQSAPGLVTHDIAEFYCPTRRSGLRPQDRPIMPAAWWPGGGTDYGGCVGRHVAYDTSGPSHNVLDAGAPNAIVFDPGVTAGGPVYQVRSDSAIKRWGIFGRVNVSSTFRDIMDGTSYTIMTGELQRITVADAGHGGSNNLSHEGWAIGGDATGFTTGYGGPAIKIGGLASPLMNNGFFQSPGSDHVGGANFGMGDGSVKFISTSLDPDIFALLGSMNDAVGCPLAD
jgi:prepilin-type N-terminal cleavage/methylation domain-containing protein